METDFVKVKPNEYENYCKMSGRLEAVQDFVSSQQYPSVEDILSILGLKKPDCNE